MGARIDARYEGDGLFTRNEALSLRCDLCRERSTDRGREYEHRVNPAMRQSMLALGPAWSGHRLDTFRRDLSSSQCWIGQSGVRLQANGVGTRAQFGTPRPTFRVSCEIAEGPLDSCRPRQ
jgi:hypothetical protein